MNIVHIRMTGAYDEKMTYQENLLTKYHAKLGHNVTLYVSCLKWDAGNIITTHEETIEASDNSRVFRKRYKKHINQYISEKLRDVDDIIQCLERDNPDIIMLHNFQTMCALRVCRYIEKHRNVKLVVDSHTTYNNSAQNILSKVLLHKLVYKRWAKKCAKYAKVIYYVVEDSKDFLTEMYGIQGKQLKYLPLGGVVYPDDVYEQLRKKRRKELGVENEKVFMHSGKLTKEKKTLSLLRAFDEMNEKNAKLIIIGSSEGEILSSINEYCKKNERILYLGWKSGNELLEYLCAADVYMQPGDESATLQNALCCKNVIAVSPYKGYKELCKDNVIFINREEEMCKIMERLIKDDEYFKLYRDKSYMFAKTNLDYEVLAGIIIEDCK